MAVEQKESVRDQKEGNTDRVTGPVKSLDSAVSVVCVFLTMWSCLLK